MVGQQIDEVHFGRQGLGSIPVMDDAEIFRRLLDDPSYDYRLFRYGDVVEGEVMHVDREKILVDIGGKCEGVVPSREFQTLSPEELGRLRPGDRVLVFVLQPEDQAGQAILSIDRARQEKTWRRLQEVFEAGGVIEAEVVNYNKGGLLVNLDGIRGFVPASQVVAIRGGDEVSKQADMARMVGQRLKLKIIEINRHRNRLILSERQAVQEQRDAMKAQLIETLREGETRRGRVTSIADFGVFVDIGGADGLVHLSEISWTRVKHPSEVLRVGDEVDVMVLSVNPEQRKIALSIRRTQPEPWMQVASQFQVGQVVRGTITQLASFGAFARLQEGVEGLIHVSELAGWRVEHPNEVLQEGDDVIVRVIRIDPARRRIGLSLRRALEISDEELEATLGPEAVLIKQELIARGITPYGTDGEEAEISDIDVESEPVDEELPAENGGDA
ncbi:30S ribosomal protein S1 [Thermomicrobium sp.]|uniref:30S ribosomal protein S1 n=1 Tax=Thermomicrobium sp. TaxID=1969469 RepID=UPI001AFE9027|nr:30S ribosomal protein S1 [Thermomicrobium sp.]MBO9306541.1 30S ribosomal protein S1 [Thermomicrobium sp.]